MWTYCITPLAKGLCDTPLVLNLHPFLHPVYILTSFLTVLLFQIILSTAEIDGKKNKARFIHPQSGCRVQAAPLSGNFNLSGQKDKSCTLPKVTKS